MSAGRLYPERMPDATRCSALIYGTVDVDPATSMLKPSSDDLSLSARPGLFERINK